MATKKIRRKPKKLLIILILVMIIGIIGSCYFLLFHHNKVKETKVVSKIPKYGYVLKSNKSTAYKKLFQKLKEILSKEKVDEKQYVKTITKMFIVDFYSLDSHVAKTDVGGTDFIYPTALENFIVNAEDTIYKYVESNIYKQRKQKLPEVDKISIDNIKIVEYIYENDKVDEEAYQVTAKWTYKNKRAASGYQTKAIFIYVHEGKKLSLVEVSEKEKVEKDQDE